MSPKKVVRAVWNNDGKSRYIPRAIEPGQSYAWRVFDQQEQRFVSDSELSRIDPNEPLSVVH